MLSTMLNLKEVITIISSLFSIILTSLTIYYLVKKNKISYTSNTEILKNKKIINLIIIGFLTLLVIIIILQKLQWKNTIIAFLIGIIIVIFLYIISPSNLFYLIQKYKSDLIDIRKRKRLFSLLIIELLFIFIFLGIIIYQERIASTGFGPPIVFASQVKMSNDDNHKKQKILNKHEEIYHVIFRSIGDTTNVKKGYLHLTRKERDAGSIIYAYSSETLNTHEDLSISSIPKLEFKKKLKIKKENKNTLLWAIEKVDAVSLVPHAKLYILCENEILLLDNDYDSIAVEEITDIFIHDALDLNGIEIVDTKDKYSIWLLGYDGTIYYCKIQKVADKDYIKGGEKLALPVSKKLNEQFNLSDWINQKKPKGYQNAPSLKLTEQSWENKGWQSLHLVDDNNDTLTFVATNAIKEKIVIFKTLKTVSDSSYVEIVNIDSIPSNSIVRWDEGSATFPKNKEYEKKKEYYIVTTNAFDGSIILGATWNGERINTLDKQNKETLTIWGSYIEGITVTCGKHTDLFVSDRDGFIYYRPCYKCNSSGILSFLICFIRRFVPAKFKENQSDWFYTINMHDLVTHGQDIAYDKDGGVWFVEENYFRRLDPALFSWGYQWSLWIKEKSLIIISMLLLSIVTTYTLARNKIQEINE